RARRDHRQRDGPRGPGHPAGDRAVLPRVRGAPAGHLARHPRQRGPDGAHHPAVAVLLPGPVHHPDRADHQLHRRRPPRRARPAADEGARMTRPEEDVLATAQTRREAARASHDVVLEVENLTVGFPTDDGLVQAVRGVSYQLRRGEVLGIVGESGSGKSVTSMAVMGLLPGTARVAGSVRFDGRELIGASDAELTRIRGRRIAMIFQDPMTSLNPVYTIGYQIAEAVRAHHDVSKEAALARAAELLEIVRIPNAKARLSNYPHELSGGMRQRVVIAIAMANDPDVIIADEPTTALDVTVQAQILDALDTAREETGAAMVLITHDLGVIAGRADR